MAVSDNMQSGVMLVNPRHEKTFKSSSDENTTTNIEVVTSKLGRLQTMMVSKLLSYFHFWPFLAMV